MMIIFTIHNIKIVLKTILHKILQSFWLRSRWDRRSLFPVILWFLIKEAIISLAIGRSLIDVFKLISVLVSTTIFIKELSVLRVITCVIFAESHVSSIIPWRHIVVFWGFTSFSWWERWHIISLFGKHWLLWNLLLIFLVAHIIRLREFSVVCLLHD
jgi:hypothetical protein